MSEAASCRRSRLFWWVGLALVLLVAAGLALLFRVPLALQALRRGLLEEQADWAVRNAGDSAVPYLRGGLDHPNRPYAGLCARHLIGLAEVLMADGRLDVIEEAVRATNHVSFEFRPAYPKGSSALGFMRWDSEVQLPPWFDLILCFGVERDGKAWELFHRSAPGPNTVGVPRVIRVDPQVEVEPSSSLRGAGWRTWFTSEDVLWLNSLLTDTGTLSLVAHIELQCAGDQILEYTAAKVLLRVVESMEGCSDLPQPIHDPRVDEWVSKNLQASLSLFQGELMLRLRSPGRNPAPLCFTITIEMDDGTRYVRPRHLVFRPGELMPMADFQTGLELTEPGTYRMRVILEGTPEAALSHPAVTRYWAGRYESPWQTLTVAEQ